MTIIEHLQNRISELEPPHTFLIAVSGGSDSMVLLHAFSTLKLKMEVAHVNYGFRKEAEDEEQMVLKFCHEHNIVCHTMKLNGYDDLNESDTNNLQQYARDKRYDFFKTIRSKNNLNYTVTAHHAADNAETVLMNIFHSTSFLGLKGMEILDNNTFRPFLHIDKEDIDLYLTEHQVPFFIDKSNLDDHYKRNFIRNKVLPLIESRIPQVTTNLKQNISNWNQIVRFYNQMINNHLKNLIKTDAETGLKFFNYKKLNKKQFNSDIMQILLNQYGFNISQKAELIKLFIAKNGSTVSNDKFQFVKQNEKIFITEKNQSNNSFLYIQFTFHHLKSGHSIHYQSLNHDIRIHYIEKNAHTELIFDNNNFYINADKISPEDTLTIRNPQPGDYIYPYGLNKKKKLNKLFIDKKIPIPLRTHQSVLTLDDYILAVIGHTTDHRYACRENTQHIIHIHTQERDKTQLD